MTRVSIIIPVHNDGRYLEETLASARAQTHQDCEIIVVDDHSTEADTRALLCRLESAGQRVLTLPAHKRGVAAARNWGIAEASGPYILPLDVDDFIAPTYAAKAAAILDAQSGVGICYCRAAFFGLKRGPWKLPPYSLAELLLHNMIFISSMFRKKDWQRAGGFDESTKFGREDHIFWLTLVASGLGVHQLPETLFWYRIKPHSREALTSRKQGERDIALKTFRSKERVYHEHLALLYERCIDLDIEKRQREKLCLWKLCSLLLRAEQFLRNIIKRGLGR